MKILRYFLSTILALSLVACDQAQQKTAEVVKPPTAIEINLRVLELDKAGKPIDALRVGEDFLKSGTDSEGALHSTLAKLYTDLGDTESAVRHLQKLNSLTNTSTTVIVTREAPVEPPAVPARAPGMVTSTDGASAVIGPNGIEVRAGSASASIRN